MGKPATTAAIMTSCLLLWAVTLDGSAPLMMKVSPRMGREPADLYIVAVVEANESNRLLEITVDSADFFASSQMELDGERAQRLSNISFRSVPRGNYIVTTRLVGRDGSRAEATQAVMVMPRFGR
jgi:hypothetical protein